MSDSKKAQYSPVKLDSKYDHYRIQMLLPKKMNSAKWGRPLTLLSGSLSILFLGVTIYSCLFQESPEKYYTIGGNSAACLMTFGILWLMYRCYDPAKEPAPTHPYPKLDSIFFESIFSQCEDYFRSNNSNLNKAPITRKLL